MSNRTYPLYLANQAVTTERTLSVEDKFTHEPAFDVCLADSATIERAIAHAVRAREPMQAMAAYERRDVLFHVANRLQERSDELAEVIRIEVGKPIMAARGEVERTIDTWKIAAEEATRISGEILPLDVNARGKGYRGMWKRVPIGVCSFITPFNFPLNLVAHKAAPAIAAGCPFILKPAPNTPVTALITAEILAEASLPEGAFSILPCTNEDATPLVEDERIRLLSFTGSTQVGWMLKANAGRKKVMLELGGNAACVIDEDTDIADAVAHVVIGGYATSGQSCISVQRVYVHESIFEAFRDELTTNVKALPTGDPRDEATIVGPMISVEAAIRVEEWINAAVASGGRVLTGGTRDGAIVQPTVMENVPRGESLCDGEAFGPVVVLTPFSDFDAVLDDVNDSDFGLQAGVFTRDIHKAMRAWDRLEVGGVCINEVPTWRADHMPYGGVKMSGLGREGLCDGIEEMTEKRMLVLRDA